MRSLFAAFAALLVSFAAFAQTSPFPPSPKVLVAVNPLTNKVYVVNEFSNSVTALDAANNTSKTIAVGSRPQFIVVNPLTNRIYVNNGGEASVSVIDGATDTNITPTPLQVGSQGPMAINPQTNVVYIVRMTSVATDEVSFLNGATNTWYTIATESFQPTAVTVNPVTNTLYVAHYGTGDVRIISAAFNPAVLHPTTFSISTWTKPFAIAVNPATNKIYVITEDARGPIGIINGATRTAVFPLPASGHASQPKAIAVNPVTNRIYALFANEVVVIHGDTNAYTYIPVNTGTGQAGIAVNHSTNKIYVSSNSGTLTVINGDTNATSTIPIPAGAESIGVNPLTNETIVHGTTTTFIDGSPTDTEHGSPLTVNITPLPADSGSPSSTISLTASNTSTNPLPIRGVYYQFDTREGAWSLADGSGPYTIPLTGLSSGPHVLNAFAIDGQIASLSTAPHSAPMVGRVATYSFSITGSRVDPTVALTSSVNPSSVGESVTLRAAVTGTGAAPTGTVTFSNGGTTLCASVAVAGGAASCTTNAIPSGSHTITAAYSGDSNYNTRNATLVQTVNLRDATAALSSTPNPSTSGQNVTFTATISGSGGTPTGTVAFTEGGTALTGCGAVALTAGAATCATTGLAVGSHTITATYSGNTTYRTATATATQVVNLRDATAALSGTPNPSTSGQNVTFTATITGSGGTPTGTVAFTDGATTLAGCGAVALSAGSATCATTGLAVGSRTITATYSGNTTYRTATATTTQVVNLATAAVTLASSANPSLVGQSVTFTANVTGGGTAPTGTVRFADGATTLCAASALTSGAATCTTSALASGGHTITATYSGDALYATGSTSITQTVNLRDATAALSSAPNPSTSGQNVTFTASISGSGGTATGTVAFSEGGTALAGCAAVALSGGVATCTTNGLSVGGHTITATYSGSSVYRSATTTTSQVVNLGTAGIALGSSAHPSLVGQSVTFTANVTGGGTAPSGTVRFADGATTLCAASTVASGTASCTTSALGSGDHTITATYSGDANYASGSTSITQTVNLRDATAALGSTPNPSASGQNVTFTATISGGGGTPTGTVAFTDGGATLAGCGAVALSGGTATCATSSLATGNHTVTATYSGSAMYRGASATATQSVNLAIARISVASSVNPSQVGQSVTFTANVSGDAVAPTGTVRFADGATTLCAASAIAAGAATCTTTALANGGHTITAAYSGDSAYATASATLTQVVNEPEPTGPSVNVALASAGASAAASSTGGENFPVASLINNERAGVNWGSGGGWKDATPNAFPDSVVITFNGAKTIDRVVVYTLQDSPGSPREPSDAMTFSNFGVTDFVVEGWTGSAWTTLASVSGNDRVKRTVTFAPLRTSQVRVTITGALNGASRLTEIEAWTAGDPPPPPPPPVGVNVALASAGTVASASSIANANFPIGAVNNGDRAGVNWGSGGGWKDATTAFPDWVQLDFNGAKTVDRVVVFSLQDMPGAPVEPSDTMTFANYGITGFTVETWNGSAWVTQATVTGNDLVKRSVAFSPVTTHRVRVNITSALGTYSRLVEVEAWGFDAEPPPAGPANVALASAGANATASSTAGAAFPVASLINGERAGMGWGSGGGWKDATANTYPDFVEIAFNGAKSIDKVVVFSLQDNPGMPVEPTDEMTFASYGVTAFTVQGWDGAAWVTLGTVTGNNLVKRTVTFPTFSTTKIRVNVTGAIGGYSRLTEIEAWSN